MTAPAGWVGLARILRPQGRKGEVFAHILTDFPEKFASRRHLWLITAGAPGPGSPATGLGRSGGGPSHLGTGETSLVDQQAGAPGPDLGTRETTNPSSLIREIELIHHWLHKGGIVLHFAGVDSISAAEELKGLIVAIPREERTPLADDETYIDDLIGCILIDRSGASPVNVGTIEDIDRTTGAAPLLIVRGASGEVLVPFAKLYLRKIDIPAKRVEMSLPEGLVDLNQ
jgi:16S rRNA processing protein RimM